MLSRRLFVISAGASLIAGAARAQGRQILTPDEAHKRVQADEITLVDIRRPDEWAETGVAEGAHKLDMRDPAMIDNLTALLDGDRTAPVAVICHRGVRSKRLSKAMVKAGFTNVYDVSEGMAGNWFGGKGWIRRGLPVVK